MKHAPGPCFARAIRVLLICMSKDPGRDERTLPTKDPRAAAAVQVAGVGFGFAGSLLLAGIVFLATDRGSETETLWTFPLWAILFLALVWRATNWRQPVARGLALLGAEFLALPLAWLLYQGPPLLSSADPRVSQTLSALALGLAASTALLAAALRLRCSAGQRPPGPVIRAVLALASAVYLGQVAYGTVLLAITLLNR